MSDTSDDDANNTVTRLHLREAVHATTPAVSMSGARKIVDAVIEEICEALMRGEIVKLHSFGVFKITAKAPRTGRNPKTGLEVRIPARKVIAFKPSPALIRLMNGEAELTEEEAYAQKPNAKRMRPST